MAEPARSAAMLELIRDLYPICRSITGPGVRETLHRMAQEVPLDIRGVPTGTDVFDWQVPPEWHLRDAYIETPDGRRIASAADHNLHVVNFSAPVDCSLSLDELLPHLHSIPEHPDWIPYRTSYYSRDWGFCLRHRDRERLAGGTYRVVVDSSIQDGELNYGELLVPGQSEEEVLVYSHLCHPSIANDNLSGLAITASWARSLLDGETPWFSYRFVWGPGTIGSITWLATNEKRLPLIRHGLVAVLLGRPGPLHYKRSRRGDAEIDRIASYVLAGRNEDSVIRDFDPYGYDERQFCSPGLDLPVGRLSRTPHGEYPEYHTSADNIEILSEQSLADALEVCERIGRCLDRNRVYENLFPYGEPQLGKRGLYGSTGGRNPKEDEYAMLWLLNQADGKNDLLSVAERSGLVMDDLYRVALALEEKKVIRKVA